MLPAMEGTTRTISVHDTTKEKLERIAREQRWTLTATVDVLADFWDEAHRVLKENPVRKPRNGK